MIKKERTVRFKSANEIFAKYIPGYPHSTERPEKYLVNHGLSDRSGSVLGKKIANELSQSLVQKNHQP